MEEGSVHVGMGKAMMGLDQCEHGRKMLWFEYIPRNLVHRLEIVCLVFLRQSLM